MAFVNPFRQLLGSQEEEASASTNSGGGFTDRVRTLIGAEPRRDPGLVDELRSAFRGDEESQGTASGVKSFFAGLGSSIDNSTRSLQTAVGLREEEEPTLLGELDQATTMSYRTRFYAFWISLGLGLTCSVLSWLLYFNDAAFATVYTVGNLIALSSSAFFWGPKTYLKMMFKKTRWMCTLAMFTMMGVTLTVVFTVGDPLALMVCIALQSACLFWYTISYIPFMRQCLTGTLKKCFGALAEDEF